MGTDNVRFAVVGCGHIGRRHIEMIRRRPDAELTAVCDLLPVDYHPVPAFSDLEKLLADAPPFDVLNICTPNGLHAQMALRALETGHHVVIEKPMALGTHDAEQILQTAARCQRHVFCVMQNRYSPPSRWLKSVIDNHLLGEIYWVQINCYWNRDARYYLPGGWHGTRTLDGGTLFTQFSHFIDLMYWLFGDITNIRARFADFNHQALTDFEDSGVAAFDFIRGGMGIFSYSTSVYDTNLESSVTILGEKGTVKLGGQYMNKVEYCHIEDYTLPDLPPTPPGNDYGAYKGSAQNHHYVIENVVDVLMGKPGASITAPASDGLRVVDMIERIYRLRV
jgi:predicted dehydrogenase